ncbi:MAG: WYL domain-containing protein, partial [Bacillota bacterium]
MSRILELVQLVAASPRRFRRRDLAGRFEVSERMIQKDLEIVRHGLKLPLFRSLNGYYFEKTPALPVLQLNFSEALALLLAVQAAGSVSGIGSPELAAAVARLEAVFPREFTVLLRRFASDKPAAAQEHRQRMLMLLKRALIEGCKLRMIYETRSRGGEANERVVCPYHLMPYVRSWQLIAYCERRREVRIFKVDRVREAMLLDERYRV